MCVCVCMHEFNYNLKDKTKLCWWWGIGGGDDGNRISSGLGWWKAHSNISGYIKVGKSQIRMGDFQKHSFIHKYTHTCMFWCICFDSDGLCVCV